MWDPLTYIFINPTTGDTMAPSANIYQKPTLKESLFSFKGRFSRTQFWMNTLYLIGFSIIAMMIIALLSPLFRELTIILIIPFYVMVVWISLAIAVKRWHDRDKSGWWVCIGFIPFIGPIWAFIETGFLEGTDGPNQFGSDPLS